MKVTENSIVVITYDSGKMEWIPVDEHTLVYLHDNQYYMERFDIVERGPNDGDSVTYNNTVHGTQWADAIKQGKVLEQNKQESGDEKQKSD